MRALVAVLLVSACSQRSGTHELAVMGPFSMEAPFRAAAPAFETAHPGVHLVLGFAPSPVLVSEVVQGQKVDVVAMADESTMRTLVADHLVQTPKPFAENALVVVVPLENPAHVAGVADLSRARVVLAKESTPGGHFARAALTAVGVDVTPIDAATVADAMKVLTKGGADASIAYMSDVAASDGKLTAIALPPAANIVVIYPVAVVTSSKDPALAAAFVASLASGPGADALRTAGFAVR